MMQASTAIPRRNRTMFAKTLLPTVILVAAIVSAAAEDTPALKPIRIVLVGKEKGVPVIDLHAASMTLFGRLGEQGSADLTASASDRTHFSLQGAEAMARLVADGVRTAVPELTPYLKRDRPGRLGAAGKGRQYRIGCQSRPGTGAERCQCVDGGPSETRRHAQRHGVGQA